ncbi:MAG TPA: PKD domain-containing protein [Thermoplasmata archaeon]|nr:PKD domain-containing protein [Thermoplasmata archaeon]
MIEQRQADAENLRDHRIPKTDRTLLFAVGLALILSPFAILSHAGGVPMAAGSGGSPGTLPGATAISPAKFADLSSAATSRTPLVSSNASAVWVNLSGPNAPSPRWGAAMAYEPSSKRLILFGGIFYTENGSVPVRYLNDTWSFQNGTWKNITASLGTAPPTRYDASLTYDARDGYLLLAGGRGFSSVCPNGGCQDFWKLTASGWVQLTPPSTFPFSGPRDQGTLMATYDSTDQYVVIADTINSLRPTPTFAYAGGNWTNLTQSMNGTPAAYPPHTFSGALVDDPFNHGVLLFGGTTEKMVPSGISSTNETWLFRGGLWHNLTANLTVQPTDQYYPTATWDNATQRIVLLAGDPVSQSSPPHLSTWQFDGNWSRLNPAVEPSTELATLAWDPATNSSILFGGFIYSHGASKYWNITDQVWQWTGTPDFGRVSSNASPNPVDVGASVTFSSNFTLGTAPFRWAWSFGDGGSSSLATPAHAYTTAGAYSVNLTLADSAGHQRVVTTQVTVMTVPSTRPSGTPNPTDVGFSTAFSAPTTGGVPAIGYAWNFGDGAGGTGANPSHAFSGSGNYTVRVWANDSGGGRVNASFVEHVHPALSLKISASPTAPSLGQLVNFTATASGGTSPYSYSWSFGDGGSGGDLQNISHIFTTNGPFTATVGATDGVGNVVFATENLTVALNLTLLASSHVGAAPLALNFQTLVQGGVPGYSYAWSFGDGAQSTLAQPTHTFAAPGYYTSVLTVADRAGHLAQSSWDVLVVPGGGPLTASLSGDPLGVPVGGSTVLSAAISGGVGSYQLDWQTNGLTCTSVLFVSERCTATHAGSFPVRLTVTDSGGGSVTSDAVTFVVGAVPATHSAPGSPSLLGQLSTDFPWFVAAAALSFAAFVGLRVVERAPPRRRGLQGSPLYAAYLQPGAADPPATSGPLEGEAGEGSSVPGASPPQFGPEDSLEDLY